MTPALFAILILASLGHLALTFLIVNVSHGSGIVSPWLNRLTLVFLGTSCLSLLCGWWWLWGEPIGEWPLGLQVYGLVTIATSLVGIPADAIRRWLRGQPTGVKERSRILDLSRPPDGGPAPIGHGIGARLLRIPGNESLHVCLHEYEIEIDALPSQLDGLSILHVSDVHFTPAFQPRFYELAFEAAARFEPDLVLFTGDLIDEDGCIPWIEPVFGRLHGRLGSYAILGNHDHLGANQTIVQSLTQSGYEILEGRWTSLEHLGVRITLGGTSAPWGQDPDPKARPDSDLCILLCHTPDRLYRVAKWGVHLMFSGHNHGGQVRLPVIGPLLMPSRFSRRFDSGFFRHDETLMYVSRGLGAEYPLRFGSQPEIAHLTFRCPRPLGRIRDAESRCVDPVGALVRD